MDPVEDLVEQRLDHALVHHDLLLVGLGSAVELDDVPQVVLRVVEQQPHLKQHKFKSLLSVCDNAVCGWIIESVT